MLAFLMQRRHLKVYDEHNFGSLTVADLEEVVCDILPDLASLSSIADDEGKKMYCKFAAARIKFFIGARNRLPTSSPLLVFYQMHYLMLGLPDSAVI